YYRNINLTSVPRTPAAPPRSESLTFNFTLFAEPKMPLISIGEVKVEEAYDENKNSMIPTATTNGVRYGRTYYGGGYRSDSQSTAAQLARPSEKSQTAKLIKGQVSVTLLAQETPEVLADKVLTAKGKKVKIGSTSFSIEDVTETPNKQTQIKMTISDDSKNGD